MTEKQVAVLVRHNQAEALRVAGGMTLTDHAVDVYVLDEPLADTPAVEEQMEVLEFADVEPISAVPGQEGPGGSVSPAALAERLPGYDAVLAL
ncbi:MAG: hypothetical protein ACLFRB_10410 [Thiohalorhabdus sp.]|uniref:hypothetical protein n=1 Tax=Thiohalorhabdus sp. TaxID=3094134 RepID=UPI003980990E